MTSQPISPSRPEVLPTHTPGLFADAVARAAERLRSGELVVLPTETVYGLAANAWDGTAVRRIFAAKGRPEGNPVIVHVASGAMARECVGAWPESADRLAAAFWPGPLTLVLPRGSRIPPEVTAGGGTVGIRWPSHPFMQAVIRACGFPLAAPSANLSNAISPTHAGHAVAGLAGRISLVVDGGASQVGIESTVVDLTSSPPRVLRPGMIDDGAIAAALGGVVVGAVVGEEVSRVEAGLAAAGTLRSPGQMPRHYAPRARLWIWDWADDEDLRWRMRAAGVDAASAHVMAYQRIPGPEVAARICVIPQDPEAYARALYAEWHRCDELGAGAIIVEAVPDGVEWRAIADRLARASVVAEME